MEKPVSHWAVAPVPGSSGTTPARHEQGPPSPPLERHGFASGLEGGVDEVSGPLPTLSPGLLCPGCPFPPRLLAGCGKVLLRGHCGRCSARMPSADGNMKTRGHARCNFTTATVFAELHQVDGGRVDWTVLRRGLAVPLYEYTQSLQTPEPEAAGQVTLPDCLSS